MFFLLVIYVFIFHYDKPNVNLFILTNANEFDAFIFHVPKSQVKVNHLLGMDLWCFLVPSDLFVCEVFQ